MARPSDAAASSCAVLRSESLAPLDRIDCISSSCGVEYFRAGANFRREACKDVAARDSIRLCQLFEIPVAILLRQHVVQLI